MPHCRYPSLIPQSFEQTAIFFYGQLFIEKRISKYFLSPFLIAWQPGLLGHLEVASASLTTDSCVNRIRRFASRRGSVAVIFSDIARKIFVTKEKLRKAYQTATRAIFRDVCCEINGMASELISCASSRWCLGVINWDRERLGFNHTCVEESFLRHLYHYCRDRFFVEPSDTRSRLRGRL